VQDETEEPRVVTVSDSESVEPSHKPARATTRDLLEAIRSIPDQVAAKVNAGDSGQPNGAGGKGEVTFAAEPLPEPEQADAGGGEDAGGGVAGSAPPPAPTRQGFRHPSRGRRRVEIGT
jgi:hypothetical protein